MNLEKYTSTQSQGGIVDLSDRAKYLLTGDDRVRYLNGQVTQDVRKVTSEDTLYACVTNGKGRIDGDIFLHASQQGAGIWVDAEAGLQEGLAARLDKYIVADDVELSDQTETWRLLHIFGAAAEPFLAQAGTGGVLRSTRLQTPGVDIWLPSGAPDPDGVAALSYVSAADWETLRILDGIPRWPAELNGEVFPQEAGLEASAMSFTKGCYIGQEILSRIKTSGKMPQRLIRLMLPVDLAEPSMAHSPSLAIRRLDGSLQQLGRITSVARHPALDRAVGLAYVRYTWDGEDSLLLADTDPPRILADAEIFKL